MTVTAGPGNSARWHGQKPDTAGRLLPATPGITVSTAGGKTQYVPEWPGGWDQ